MKNSKMLAIVAMFAVVGGAMAFKAKKFDRTFCISTTWIGASPLGLSGAFTNITSPIYTTSYYTTPANNTNLCTIKTSLISTIAKTFVTNVEL